MKSLFDFFFVYFTGSKRKLASLILVFLSQHYVTAEVPVNSKQSARERIAINHGWRFMGMKPNPKS
jgi:hypothetical protein